MQIQKNNTAKSLSLEQVSRIREVLATGIARTLVHTAITELHKENTKDT